MASYVGVDVHRRRSVIVVLDENGERVWSNRIENSRLNLEVELRSIQARVEGPVHVVIEATWGWYWAADVVEEVGAIMHLAHPLGIKGFENRRVKNDDKDAVLLADLLRMNRLPEAWVAPRPIRELRELVRYRNKLSQLQIGLKAQIHQTLGKQGMIPETKSIWHSGGQRWLDELQLADAYTNRIESLRDLLALYHREIATLDGLIHRTIVADDELREGYEAIQAIGGVGRVLGAVFVAEIGDANRFPTARQLSSWAGLTPRHRESDDKVRRGRITKQGPALVRWAAVEAVTSGHCDPVLRAMKRRIGERRGPNVGKVAAARQLLTLVFFGCATERSVAFGLITSLGLRDQFGRGCPAVLNYGINPRPFGWAAVHSG